MMIFYDKGLFYLLIHKKLHVMSTHNIGFYGELTKLFFSYHQITILSIFLLRLHQVNMSVWFPGHFYIVILGFTGVFI